MRVFALTSYGIPKGLLIALAIVMVLIALVAVIDAARRPAGAFEQIGQKKNTWLLLLILTGIMCGPFGTAVSIYYLAAIRPKLVAT